MAILSVFFFIFDHSVLVFLRLSLLRAIYRTYFTLPNWPNLFPIAINWLNLCSCLLRTHFNKADHYPQDCIHVPSSRLILRRQNVNTKRNEKYREQPVSVRNIYENGYQERLKGLTETKITGKDIENEKKKKQITMWLQIKPANIMKIAAQNRIWWKRCGLFSFSCNVLRKNVSKFSVYFLSSPSMAY